jgi:hypothetical protein
LILFRASYICESIQELSEIRQVAASSDEVVAFIRHLGGVSITFEFGEVSRETIFFFGETNNREEKDAFFDVLERKINKFGWHVEHSKQIERTHPSLSRFWFRINLELDYTKEFKPLPEFLYHLTDIDRVSSILKRGLVPSKSVHYNTNYPARTFFTLDNSWVRRSSDDIILQIATSNLFHVKFFIDKAFPNSVWTDKIIPPAAIEVL